MGQLGVTAQLEIQTSESLLSGLSSGTGGTAFTHEEWARAQGIASTRRRAQFLAGRVLAKRMLSHALGSTEGSWRISADATAKPQVIGADVQLSIAHSGSFVACAIASQPVGIDIEHMARARPVADMAALVCSAPEQSALQHVQGAAAGILFMQWWTRKEARLKQLDMPFGFSQLRAIQTTAADPSHAEVASWSFHEPRLVVSLAASNMAPLRTCWPEHWAAPTVEWHCYF